MAPASDSPWSRIRKGRLVQVVLVYLGASWAILEGVDLLRDTFQLPPWVGPTAFILLAIGLLVMLATAWVQSHPLVDRREEADEVPSSWELDFGELKESLTRGRMPHLTWARAVLGGVFAFSLLFGLAGLYVVIQDRGRSLAPEPLVAGEAAPGIAVLPFSVRGAGLEEWREGMVDLLSTGLDGAGGLRAIDPRTVLARWEELVADGTTADERVTLEVARRTGARYALLGLAVAIGPTVRLVAEVHALTGETPVQAVQVEGPPDSVLALADRLAMQALGVILGRGDEDVPRVDIASLTTPSLPALKAYLEGEALFRAGDFAAAVEAYERSVAEDSAFALAHYRLGGALSWILGEEGSARYTEAVERAFQLVDRLPEREALLVRAARDYTHFRVEAVDTLRRAVRRYPDEAEAWYLLGDAYLHLPETLGTWEEAEPAFRRAVELAPRFAPYRIHLIDAALSWHADSALAADRIEAYARLAPETPGTRRYRMAADLAFGDSAHRAAALARVDELTFNELYRLQAELSHPRFWELREKLLRRRLELAEPDRRSGIIRSLTWNSVFNRGHLAKALALTDDPDFDDVSKLNLLYVMDYLGFPVPADRLEEAIGSVAVDTAGGGVAFQIGAWAIDHSRSGLQTEAVTRLRELSDSLRAAGDTAAAGRPAAGATCLTGQAARRQGDTEKAIRILESCRVEARDGAVRWWLAEVYTEAGRLEEAARYYRRFMMWSPDPVAAARLGPIYEASGDLERAREAYRLFVTSWADPDPELQPMVEDAKRRLLRLMDDIGE